MFESNLFGAGVGAGGVGASASASAGIAASFPELGGDLAAAVAAMAGGGEEDGGNSFDEDGEEDPGAAGEGLGGLLGVGGPGAVPPSAGVGDGPEGVGGAAAAAMFAPQLAQLADMGFTDEDQLLPLLIQHGGMLERVMGSLF
jgi:hypothetical protein